MTVKEFLSQCGFIKNETLIKLQETDIDPTTGHRVKIDRVEKFLLSDIPELILQSKIVSFKIEGFHQDGLFPYIEYTIDDLLLNRFLASQSYLYGKHNIRVKFYIHYENQRYTVEPNCSLTTIKSAKIFVKDALKEIGLFKPIVVRIIGVNIDRTIDLYCEEPPEYLKKEFKRKRY